MAFDADYPFDVEVCEEFNDHMCDIHFTGIDHMTEMTEMAESLDAPPEFEMVEYEEVDYKDIKYEEPEQ